MLHDAVGGVYKKLVLQDDKLVGAVLYGDTADGAWYFQMMRDGKNIARNPRPPDVRPDRIWATPATRGRTSAAAMPDEMEVCGCNGVCKGDHRQGDQGKGPVHAGRRAQAHQGFRFLRLLHRPGGADSGLHRWAATMRRSLPTKPMCGCTDHTHEEVRAAIREQKLLSIPAGDAVPGMAHAQRLRHLPPGAQLLPDLAPGRTRRRTIRNRASSTSAPTPTSRRTAPYSVVPRMWGGITNAGRAAPHRRRGRQIQGARR